MLAIAAPYFGSASETFLRDHVRTTAPGETILLCERTEGTEQFDAPVLRYDLPSSLPAGLIRRVLDSIRLRWRVYFTNGLDKAGRMRIASFLAKYRPKALLAEYGTTGYLLARPCREAHVPLFVQFHGIDANVSPDKAIVRVQYKRLFPNTKGVIVASNFLRERLLDLGCPEDKLFVCPLGVDVERFSADSTRGRPPTVLMVSRLKPQKGPIHSIQSFARVHKAFPDARLEVVGDGPLRRQCEAEAQRLGLEGQVTFHGARDHEFVRDRMRATCMLIQHCVTVPGGGVESLGLSILEAMACELPVVATRHGAIMETVQDTVSGFLVEEGDVEAMADAMLTLLNDPERAAQMGAAGRQRVLAEFAQERTRDRLRAILGLPPIDSGAALEA